MVRYIHINKQDVFNSLLMKELKLNKRKVSQNDFKDSNLEPSEPLSSERLLILQFQLEAKDSIILDLKKQFRLLEEQSTDSNSKLSLQLRKANEEIKSLKKERPKSQVDGSTVGERQISEYIDQIASLKLEVKNIALINDSMESEILSLQSAIRDKDEEIARLKENNTDFRDENDYIKELEKKLKFSVVTTANTMQKNAVLSKSNQSLKIKLEKVKTINDKLCRQTMTTRGKHKNPPAGLQTLKKQLSGLSSDPASPGNNTPCPDTLFFIKVQIERIYKMFMGELNTVNDGERTMFTISTSDFCSIEHELNNVIMKIQEKIDSSVDLSLIHI